MKLGKKLSDSIGEVEEDKTGAKVDKLGAVGGCSIIGTIKVSGSGLLS